MSIADSVATIASLDNTVDSIATAIRPITLEQVDSGPVLIYETLESEAITVGLAPTGYWKAMIRFHVAAPDKDNCVNLAEALKDALNNYSESTPVNEDITYIIRQCLHSGESSLLPAIDDGDSVPSYWIKTVDFEVTAKK